MICHYDKLQIMILKENKDVEKTIYPSENQLDDFSIKSFEKNNSNNKFTADKNKLSLHIPEILGISGIFNLI